MKRPTSLVIVVLLYSLIFFVFAPETSAQDGLIGYWKFDEGAGNKARDSSGNGRDGTLNNGPQWVDGRYGKALNFDGIDDYVDYQTLFSPGLSSLTIIAWVNSPLNKVGFVVYHGNNGEVSLGNGFTETATEPQRIVFYVKLADGIWYKAASSAASPGAWHQIAGVWSKGQFLRVYVDGVVSENVTVPDFDLFSPGGNYLPSIGAYNRGAGGFFSGTIDEVRMYNRVLSEEEIRADVLPPARTPSIGLNEIYAMLMPIVAVAIHVLVTFFYLRWYFKSNKIFDVYVTPTVMNYKVKTLLLAVGMLILPVAFLVWNIQLPSTQVRAVDPLGTIFGGGFAPIFVLFFQVLLLCLAPGLLTLGLVFVVSFMFGWWSLLAAVLITTSLHFSAVHAVDTLIERIDRAGYSQLASRMRMNQRVGVLAFFVTMFKPLMFVNIFRRAKKRGELDVVVSITPVASVPTGTGEMVWKRVESQTVTLPPLFYDTIEEYEKALDKKIEEKKQVLAEKWEDALEHVEKITDQLDETGDKKLLEDLDKATLMLTVKLDNMSQETYERIKEEVKSLSYYFEKAADCFIGNGKFETAVTHAKSTAMMFINKNDFEAATAVLMTSGNSLFIKKNFGFAVDIFARATSVVERAAERSEREHDSRSLEFWTSIGYDLSIWQISCQLCMVHKVDKNGAHQLTVLLETGEREVRAAAARALGTLKISEAATALLKSLEDRESEVRAEAVRALENVGGESAVPIIIKRLEDSDDTVRFNAVEALRNIGGKDAIAPLKILQETEPEERREVINEAIKAIEERTREK